MNYYEYRLHEIEEEIHILSTRTDTTEPIRLLREERDRILQQLRGEDKYG